MRREAAGGESRFYERTSLLEVRMAVLEVHSNEEDESWTKVKSPRRRPVKEPRVDPQLEAQLSKSRRRSNPPSKKSPGSGTAWTP